jgi:hypothetical protein
VSVGVDHEISMHRGFLNYVQQVSVNKLPHLVAIVATADETHYRALPSLSTCCKPSQPSRMGSSLHG